MKNIFTPVIISLCLLRVWSENPRNGPINLRSNQSRRQAEEKEEASAAPSPAAPSPAAPSPAAPSPAAPSPAAPSSAASVPPAPSPIQTGAPSASVVRQSSGASASTAYALPAGSEVIIGEIKTTFSCDGRIYGYYADIDNNCQVFHVCVPYQDLQNGLDEMIQYSFFCGNQTVFDQEALVCNYVDDAFPCSEAASLYDQVNQNFGDTDRPFRQKRASNKLTKNLDNN